MTSYEIDFPIVSSEGADGGPGFATGVVEMGSGQDQLIARRSQAKRRYNVNLTDRSLEDIRAVVDLYLRVGGSAGIFRYKDQFDYASTEVGRLWGEGAATAISFNDQQIGTGDGATTQFQLIKTYGDSPQHVRTIQKPVSGTVVVGIDGVNQTSGWSVDTTTGLVTFTSAPTLGQVITAGYQFDVPVRFGAEVDQLLRVVMDNYETGAIPQLPLVEQLSVRTIDEAVPMRGATFVTVVADTSISLAYGLWVVTTSFSGLKLVLPNKSGVDTGGPIVALQNAGLVNDLDVVDQETGTTQFTLTAASKALVYLRVDASGNKIWEGF